MVDTTDLVERPPSPNNECDHFNQFWETCTQIDQAIPALFRFSDRQPRIRGDLPLLVLFVGPTCAGKGELSKEYRAKYPFRTATSKPPLNGHESNYYHMPQIDEVRQYLALYNLNGVTAEEDEAIADYYRNWGHGRLVECRRVNSEYYGIPQCSIDTLYRTGIAFGDVNIEGVATIAQLLSGTAEVLAIAVMPSTQEELWKRLQQSTRNGKAARWEEAQRYPQQLHDLGVPTYVIRNGNLDEAHAAVDFVLDPYFSNPPKPRTPRYPFPHHYQQGAPSCPPQTV